MVTKKRANGNLVTEKQGYDSLVTVKGAHNNLVRVIRAQSCVATLCVCMCVARRQMGTRHLEAAF